MEEIIYLFLSYILCVYKKKIIVFKMIYIILINVGLDCKFSLKWSLIYILKYSFV